MATDEMSKTGTPSGNGNPQQIPENDRLRLHNLVLQREILQGVVEDSTNFFGEITMWPRAPEISFFNPVPCSSAG